MIPCGAFIATMNGIIHFYGGANVCHFIVVVQGSIQTRVPENEGGKEVASARVSYLNSFHFVFHSHFVFIGWFSPVGIYWAWEGWIYLRQFH